MGELIEFKAWPKTPRLYRDMVVTEKIDGTNAAIGIIQIEDSLKIPVPTISRLTSIAGVEYLIYAQSRKRNVTPESDNYGFAAWVWGNDETLIPDLGPGLHFGEWWGYGIQRGYGIAERRFSLFNTAKWEGVEFLTPGLGAVPVICRHTFSTYAVNGALEDLRENGSYAAPGFMNPEGVVVYHTAGNTLFKATFENDDIPKGLAA